MKHTDDTLSQFDKISHGFFGRKGGVSNGIYSSLNCGLGTDDDIEAVRENRKRVAKALTGKSGTLLTLHQVHSDICVEVEEPFSVEERPQADAMVTDKSGLILGVLTADCVPVLFYGEKSNGTPVIGAAHAGWGGAYKGVLCNTVQMMKDKQAQNIYAVIGPCIHQQSYEVQNDFMERFVKQDAKNSAFFIQAPKAGHMMFDLPGYVEKRLRECGVQNISKMDIDTYTHEESFFSYRRATHKNEPDYGRQISAISIL